MGQLPPARKVVGLHHNRREQDGELDSRGPESRSTRVQLREGRRVGREPIPAWPADATSFLARDAELGELRSYLEDGARLMTIHGTFGVGKTRLMRRWGELAFAEGEAVAFADLTSAVDGGDLCEAVARALDVPLGLGAAVEDAIEQLGHALVSRGRLLVLLDNFERLVGFAAATLGRWLVAAPEATLLVTSRWTLGLSEEVRLELRPFDVDDGVALFEDRARRQQAAVEDAQRAAVEAIVRRLDGLPLAIELAAARAVVLSPSAIETRLSQRFALLRTTRRDVPERHLTLERAIDWSWHALAPWEQAALGQCAVFRGGFSVEAAEAVVDLSAFAGAPPVLDVVQALLEKSLLRRSVAGEVAFEGRRFGLFESIRDYAAARIEEPCALAARSRHARYYVELGESLAAEARGPAPQEPSRKLRLEADNLTHAARGHAHEPELAVRAAVALCPLPGRRGHGANVLSLLEDLRPIVDERIEPPLAVPYLRALADAKRAGGRLPEALTDLERALALARSAGRADLEAAVLCDLADVARLLTRHRDAHLWRDQAAATAREIGDVETLAIALSTASDLDLDAPGEEAFELVRRMRSPYMQARALYGFARRVGLAGDVERGADCVRQARDLSVSVGDAPFAAWMDLALSAVDEIFGRWEAAGARITTALGVARNIGSRELEAMALLYLGYMRHAEGRIEDAASALEEGLSLGARGSVEYDEAFAWASLAALEATRDRMARAEEHLGRARAAADRARDLKGPLHEMFDLFEGVVDLGRARQAAAAGREAEARDHRASALRSRAKLGELRRKTAPFVRVRQFALMLERDSRKTRRSSPPSPSTSRRPLPSAPSRRPRRPISR